MTTPASAARFLRRINGREHRPAVLTFVAIVVVHWAEHVAQAVQVYVLRLPPADAGGLLGEPFPVLIRTESLHYAYALAMLIGLLMLRGGFVGRARTAWDVALAVQLWHHFEHLLLLGQAALGVRLLGRDVPTSVLQLVIPRLELHLLYNLLVFIPILVAAGRHWYPTGPERALQRCTCATAPERVPVPA